MKDKELSYEESFVLINKMINTAKNNLHDSGIGPMLWGIVIPVCSIETFLEIKEVITLPFSIWFLTVIALIIQVYVSIKQSKNRKAINYDDVAINLIWMVFGIGIGMIVWINSAVFNELNILQSDFFSITGKKAAFHFSEFTSAYFLLWYGFPGIITGGIKKFKPMLIGGIICWVLSIATLYTHVANDMLLVAIGAIAAWLIPGIILRRKYSILNQKVHV